MGGKVLRVKDVTESLGFKAKGREMKIRFLYQMLQDNYKALREALKNVEEHPISTLDPEQRNKLGKNGFDLEGRFDFLYEVTSPTVRALTNYVASISALRYAFYKMDKFISKKKGKSNIGAMMTDKFADNPEAAFLIDLRDNCLHGHGTQPSFMMENNNVNGKWVPSNYFYFDKNILKKDEWDAKSKDFINSWSGKKKLIDIVDAYQNEIDEFYASALDYYHEAFKEDLKETRKMEDEFSRSRQGQ